MRFYVLGRLDVRDDRGGQRRIRHGKQRDVLGLLLLRRNSLVPVTGLIDTLWDVGPPSSARKNLQTYVWHLRRALGKDDAHRLRHEPPGYLIEVGPDELDLDRFENVIGQGRRALDAGDQVAARGLLQTALSYWQGQPLANTGLDPRTCPQLAQLVERYLTTLEKRIQIDLRLGNGQDLIPELRRLTIEHPLRERLHCQLMVALHHSGRQVEALQVYADVDSLLRRQFGMEPGRLLRGTQRAILTEADTLETLHELDTAFPVAVP
ncbi:AfsR/SARP family transcriptional regulator [Virgisporangium aurantiacum]|nr:AfsR/SARP family transcriptional regulator [Virgisporangium aurantiacum]